MIPRKFPEMYTLKIKFQQRALLQQYLLTCDMKRPTLE